MFSNEIVSLKYGGTSMQNASSIKGCTDIIESKKNGHGLVVTVSAVAGITSMLYDITELIQEKRIIKIEELMLKINEKHISILLQLTDSVDIQEEYKKLIGSVMDKLRLIVFGHAETGDISDKMRSAVLATGESLSSLLMECALVSRDIKAKKVSGSSVVKCYGEYLESDVDFKKTRSCCKKIILPMILKRVIPIVEGFVGSNEKDEIMILGRGGSDFTATILASALGSSFVEIWTDVNGIMSADPRINKKAISWKRIDWGAMSEMSCSGAKVLHPKAIITCMRSNIPVKVLNTFSKKFSGTMISKCNDSCVRSVLYQGGNSLISIKNEFTSKKVGFISDISTCVTSHKMSVDVCVTSEISVSFSFRVNNLPDEMLKDIKSFGEADYVPNIGKISIVGTNLFGIQDLMKSVYSIIQESSINIYACSISPNGSNITFLTSNCDQDFIDKMHEKLILNKHKNLSFS